MNSVLIGLLAGLIVLIRPINILFFLFIGFLDIKNLSDYLSRLRLLLNRNLIVILTVFGLVFLPQIIYWQYSYGSFFVDTYPNEHFIWTRPMILHSLFSPHNGLFPYGPAYLIIFLTSIYMSFKRIGNGLLMALIIIILAYVFSSWYDWTFGCSFGARSYIEYLGILCIPLAFFTSQLINKQIRKSIFIWMLYIFIVYCNYRISMEYESCFSGSNSWDWPAYFNYYEWLVK